MRLLKLQIGVFNSSKRQLEAGGLRVRCADGRGGPCCNRRRDGGEFHRQRVRRMVEQVRVHGRLQVSALLLYPVKPLSRCLDVRWSVRLRHYAFQAGENPL